MTTDYAASTDHAGGHPGPIPARTLLDALGWRYATKAFDPSRRIDEVTWSALERAAVLSPSSYGLQPWRFVVITDPGTRSRLREASYGQPQITDASHLVVFARRATMTEADIQRHIDRIVEVRGVESSSLDGLRGAMLGSIVQPRPGFDPSAWAARQVYISLGFFLSAAANLGVDACPMEGFDAAAYDLILGLPEQGYLATVVAAAGYRSAGDPFASMKKVRFDSSATVVRV